jgi:chromosome segregation ATPase
MRTKKFETRAEEVEKIVLGDISRLLRCFNQQTSCIPNLHPILYRFNPLFIDLMTAISQRTHSHGLMCESVRQIHVSVLEKQAEIDSCKIESTACVSKLIELDSDGARLLTEIEFAEASIDTMRNLLAEPDQSHFDTRKAQVCLRADVLKRISDCESRIATLFEQKLKLDRQLSESSAFDNRMQQSSDRNSDPLPFTREVQQRIKFLAQQYAQTEDHIREHSRKQDQLVDAMKRLEGQCSMANQQQANLILKNGNLKNSLENLRANARKLRVGNATTSAKMSIAHKLLEDARTTYKSLQESISTQKVENQSLCKSLSRTSHILTHLASHKSNLKETTEQTTNLRRGVLDQVSALQCLINAQEESKKKLAGDYRLAEDQLKDIHSEVCELKEIRDSLLMNHRLRSKELNELQTLSAHKRIYIMTLDSTINDLVEISRKIVNEKNQLESETKSILTLLVESQAATRELQAVFKCSEEERMQIRELDANIASISSANMHPWSVKRILSQPLREQLETLTRLQSAHIKAQANVVELSETLFERRKNLITKGVVRELMDVSGLIQKYKSQKDQLIASETQLSDLHAKSHNLEEQVRNRLQES